MAYLNEQMEASIMSMSLMKSEDFTDSSEFKNTVVYNFRTLDFSDLTDFLSSNPEAFEYVNVDANHKIETVAQRRYSDKNYWDLLLLLNDKNMIEDMPKTNDLLIDEINEKVENYFKNYQGNIVSHTVEEDGKFVQKTIKDFYKEYLLEKADSKNLERQKFLALKPEYKKQFLRTVKYKI